MNVKSFLEIQDSLDRLKEATQGSRTPDWFAGGYVKTAKKLRSLRARGVRITSAVKAKLKYC